MGGGLYIEITVPQKVLCRVYGYEFLSEVAAKAITLVGSTFTLDFTKCEWFDGNLCAVLGGILDGLVMRKNQVYFSGLSRSLQTTFTRNNFLKSFSTETESMASLTIPYKKFKIEDEEVAKDFIHEQLFNKPDMPILSEEARRALLVRIFEICVNAITHGQSTHVYVCGQIYPTRNPPEVSLTFSDLGKTIKANVNEYLRDELTGNKTILWALEEGNTTKSGAEPGGIGLKLIESLVNLNKGSLQIVSGDGFVELRNGVYIEHQFEEYFPGTIVNLKLLLGDSNFYVMPNEIDIDNIF
jgi:hypothetical protein